MTSPPFAEFDAVTKDYQAGVFRRRPVRILTDITFRVDPGVVYGVLGPNRAGKTTLVKILLTLTRASTGRALRFGEPVARRSTLARIGFTHEHQAFPPYLTASKVLDYYGTLAGVGPATLTTTATKLLERVQLADRSADPVGKYSKGMIARLGLAQSLLNDPDLLVLDEPYEGLDLNGQKLVHDIIRERRTAGKSVLLITHSPADIETLCDRVLLLRNGKQVFEGTPAELLRDPTNDSRQPLEKALQRYLKYSV